MRADLDQNSVMYDCDKCQYKFERKSDLTSHNLKTHVVDSMSKIFESQVNKLMSNEVLMDMYGFQPGTLGKLFSEGSEKVLSHIVQVVSVTNDSFQISDGEHVIKNCVTDEDSMAKFNSMEAKNFVIKVNKWNMVKIIPDNKTSKQEYGLQIENYEFVEKHRSLPVLGSPKFLKVEVKLDEKTDLHQIIANLLENISVSDNVLVEQQKEWTGKMLRILKKSKGMWMCSVCRIKISGFMDDKVCMILILLEYLDLLFYVSGCKSRSGPSEIFPRVQMSSSCSV